jgi:hypothetical protein
VTTATGVTRIGGGVGRGVGRGVGGGVGAARSSTIATESGTRSVSVSSGCNRATSTSAAVMMTALGIATANRRARPGSTGGDPTFVFMREVNDSSVSRGSRSGEANGPACSSNL